MKTTKLYLVRHGEVFNPHQIVYGRLPGFGLSETGKKQAEALGTFLQTKPITAVYASPLVRAQETASYVAKHFPHVSLVTDERLMEIRSVVDGKPNSIMFARKWNFYTPDLTREGGEKLSEIWQRMQAFLFDITVKHTGEEVVAVSHGDPIMIVRAKGNNKRLGLQHIRGKEYVPHASGIALELRAHSIVTIVDLY